MMQFTKLFVILLVLGLAGFGFTQTYVITPLDSAAADSMFEANVEGPPSRIDMTDDHTDFVEGTGALKVKYVIGSFHQWGSYGNMIYRTDSTQYLDWTVSDSLSIWIKVHEAPTHPEYMVFRIHIADQPDPSDQIEEYIYENTTVLDNTSDWIELKVPLVEREQPGNVVPDETGFILAPNDWNMPRNNEQLDWDKIVGFNLSAVTSGWDPANNLPADSVVVSYDNFTRFGSKAVPFIVFNGMALNTHLTQFEWGQSSAIIEEGAGATPGTNAIKWTQGNEWGNGWTGFGYNIDPAQNMLGGWMTDSVKFKMKAPAGTGPLRIQFESGADGKVGYVFTPTDDGAWHDYAIPLRDLVYQDNTSNFDTTAVTVVQMMAEASGEAGRVIYIDDWWTGKPDFDVIPPNPPAPVLVTTGSYKNVVTWVDPEPNAVYNIYFSESPITNVSAPGVEWAGRVESTPPSVFEHSLVSPSGDSTVTYYYAVTATDEAGNVSDPATFQNAVTNTAKGIVTISMNPPANFTADGNLAEWSSVTPIRLFPSEGAHIVTNTTVSGDNDLSVLTYIAMDNDYLYVAFDVTDDVIDNSAGNSWEQDSPDLFIGLYDWRGKPHGAYGRGAEPDYHFRFNEAQAIIDNLGGAVILPDTSADYFYGPKFPAGYIVEAKISFADLAAIGGDDLFTPVEGMKVPLDLAINDADGGGVRQGIMTLSPFNNDNSWQSPSYWVFTWIGNRFSPVVAIDDPFNTVVTSFELRQNYPNPFNPTTTIQYAVAKPGLVQLDVYNTIGQKVRTLVNKVQLPGEYQVQFDASNLASGIYFYHLKAGEFNSVKKMILMK
ncbi:MAG: hypothetical protein Kow0037_21980 [Calditrichia bacterium]